MTDELTDQEWLEAMKIIDPSGHSQRVLQLKADSYGVQLSYFVNTIENALCTQITSPVRNPMWVWAVLNDIVLMEHFDNYCMTHDL